MKPRTVVRQPTDEASLHFRQWRKPNTETPTSTKINRPICPICRPCPILLWHACNGRQAGNRQQALGHSSHRTRFVPWAFRRGQRQWATGRQQALVGHSSHRTRFVPWAFRRGQRQWATGRQQALGNRQQALGHSSHRTRFVPWAFRRGQRQWATGRQQALGNRQQEPSVCSADRVFRSAAFSDQTHGEVQSGKWNVPDDAGRRVKMISTGSNPMDHGPLPKDKERRTDFDNN
jgi:hypothetical protein